MEGLDFAVDDLVEVFGGVDADELFEFGDGVVAGVDVFVETVYRDRDGLPMLVFLMVLMLVVFFVVPMLVMSRSVFFMLVFVFHSFNLPFCGLPVRAARLRFGVRS